MNKVTTVKEAVKRLKSGDTLLVGGFLKSGAPETILEGVLNHNDATDLTIVSNDSGTVEMNTIKIMQQGRVKKVIASYIGLNPATGQMLMDNPDSVELCPQGTLAERIRAGGAGIVAFYSPVGVGTIVENGKEKRNFNGKDYLLETSLRGNVAFIKATIADKAGNCFLKGSTKSFNSVMA
ncbi:MAG: CoA transferase subunit A, partial [Clostridiales bacterium]|nr:CoA transferase subunit A [Clostridiales bacterium]